MSVGVIDPESAQVALDRAMAVGLMGYPPILGKRVTVRGPASCMNEASLVREPDAYFGVVETVGPLGFIVGNVEIGIVMEDGTLHTSSGPDHAFFPWSTIVSWNDAAPPEEPKP